MSVAHWDAVRLVNVGPDGHLAWDRLPHVAIYRAHPRGSLRMSSNAGATIHAYGVKASRKSFGREPDGEITAASGKNLSLMMEAKQQGMATGLVQSASLTDPGTAVFVARAKHRDHHDRIAAQLIASDVDVMLGGGERFLLPRGAKGRFGPGERGDGRDLIAEARKRGYKVVYTREQLLALRGARKVLGIFAHGHTFNDEREEMLARKKLPHYAPAAPTMAEMVQAALRLLSARKQRFLLVGEEEGTDNFANKENAPGFLEAGKRTDDAIEVVRGFIEKNPETLLIVASDSNATGPQIGVTPNYAGDAGSGVLAPRARNGCPADGVSGEGTPAFTSQPDSDGKRYPFSIVWGADDDTLSNMVVRAGGLNAQLLHGTVDNTAVYTLMYYTLFGRCLGALCR
jgi:alkaline phosphatase